MTDSYSASHRKPPSDSQTPLSAAAMPDARPDAQDASESPMAPSNKRKIRIGGMVLALVVLLGVALYWLDHRNLETTDDAFVDGRDIQIAPQVAGVVVKLNVADNQFVHAGDVLFEIDPRIFQQQRNQAAATLEEARGRQAGNQYGHEIAEKNFPARLQQAAAVLATARANLLKAQNDYDREIALAPESRTGQELDAARAALDVAKAQVADARGQVLAAEPVKQNIDQAGAQVSQSDAQLNEFTAQLQIAELNLSFTRVRAPQDGWITKRSVEVGNYVVPGQQVLSIVSPQIWITANFKEDQLARMRPQQPVTVTIDAYPDLKLQGHIDSMQLGSGARFAAFPAENATGNFVKIVQRVPVKIVIDSGLDAKRPLPLGASAVPTVDLH